VAQGRHIWWTQLTGDGGWLLQVVDEAGEEIAAAAHHDPVEARRRGRVHPAGPPRAQLIAVVVALVLVVIVRTILLQP
jgi:hypothetical protein